MPELLDAIISIALLVWLAYGAFLWVEFYHEYIEGGRK